MGWFDGFKSRLRGGQKSTAPEQKTNVPAPVSANPSPIFMNSFFSPAEISAYDAWSMYKTVSAFAKVIDLIADEVARLTPVVRINGKIIDGHPIIDFMKRPGFNRTRARFIKELTVQTLVTGTGYVHAFGNTAIPGMPIALDVIKSKFVSVIPGGDMWPASYQYSEGTRSHRFQRDGNPRDMRWIEPNGLGEIVPIYDMDGDTRGIGLSRLNSIKHDVELRLKGIQHNNAVMDNGARLTGVLAFKEELTQEQRDDLLAQFRAQASGSHNAGKVMITGGGENNFTPLSQNVKDLDFKNLIQLVEDAIVARHNVPVTLFRTEAQTNNNYEVAWRMFYNMAVLPAFEMVYSGLAQIFTERLGMEIEIVHDALTNPILAQAAANRARELFAAHLVSRNEGRDICGYEPVLGGDTIYGPMGDVPQAQDYFTGREEEGGADLTAEAFHASRNEKLPDGIPLERQPPPADDKEADKKPDRKPEKKPKPKADDKKSVGAYATLLDFASYIETPKKPDRRPVRRAA